MNIDAKDLFDRMTEEVKIKVIKAGYSFEQIADLMNEYNRLKEERYVFNIGHLVLDLPFTLEIQHDTGYIVDINFN